jgi:hypothetical protein
VLNVFNLLQWCFNRLIPTQSPHSGVNVSPEMAVPDQGFKATSVTITTTSMMMTMAMITGMMTMMMTSSITGSSTATAAVAADGADGAAA